MSVLTVVRRCTFTASGSTSAVVALRPGGLGIKSSPALLGCTAAGLAAIAAVLAAPLPVLGAYAGMLAAYLASMAFCMALSIVAMSYLQLKAPETLVGKVMALTVMLPLHPREVGGYVGARAELAELAGCRAPLEGLADQRLLLLPELHDVALELRVELRLLPGEVLSRPAYAGADGVRHSCVGRLRRKTVSALSRRSGSVRR